MRFVIGLAIVSSVWAAEFNRDIRPILSDRCYSCHGPDSNGRKANLRLDHNPGPEALKKVLARVTTTNKALRMPPAYMGQDPLKPAEVEALKTWIDEGGTYQSHWSLIPPRKRPVPRKTHPIDFFVKERLAREGLSMSPPASRETLIRRVSLDLTGLPPTPQEVDAFVADKSSDAFEKVVDRLLDSKRYAERMTIRWLEAARYADTNGYQTDGERSMWRWRDWVLNAFDRNMPFDQFTIEQLAGDLLPNATRDQLIATGFNRNHRTSAEGGIIDEEFRVEYVADRTETTATVWMGLTVGCARCHDHKYDPITQKEFFQLFAFFNQMREKGFVYNFGNEEPYVAAPTPEMAARQHEIEQRVDKWDRKWHSALRKKSKEIARYEVPQHWLPGEDLIFRHAGGNFTGSDGIDAGFETVKLDYLDPFTFAATVRADEPNGAILSKSEDYWEGTGHGLYLVDGRLRLHVVFRWTDLGMRLETENPIPPGEHRLHVTYDGKRKPSGFHIYVDGVEQPLKVLFNELSWPIASKEPFRIGAGGGKRFKGQIRDVAVWKRVVSLAELTDKQLAWLENEAPEELKQLREEGRTLRSEKKKFDASVPTVMVMRDDPGVRKSYLLKRGVYDQHGEEVQPGVPEALPPLPAGKPADRLALARWLVSKENPLTARVTVNRFWQHLFGAGIVKTVEDFGSQGDWPVYEDLLDWLAADFMDNGWDLKRLLKLIVTSDTYRQSSRITPELLSRDPENRLYARAPRLRLGPEEVRDQALFVSGRLVEKFGGPSVRPPQPPGLWNELAGGKEYQADDGEGRYRRSVYTYWRRTIQPPAMITFDSPTRETCSVRETRTNTPLQALNLMNDETYLEAADKLSVRMQQASDPIEEGYRLVLGRKPSGTERELVQKAHDRFGSWNPVASILLNLDETVTRQ